MKHRYSLGIGINLFDARAVLLRDDGKVINEVERKHETVNANKTIEVLLELFESMLQKAKTHKEKIDGVGLALGGIVDNRKGVAYWPQQQDSSYIYISLPFKNYLEKKFGLPVFIENDANACAWAEYQTHFPKHKNLLYMFSGVGCGMVLNGGLYRGSDGGAGELFLNPKKKMSSLLGDFSFLHQWPADLNIVKRAKELISLGKQTSLVKRISSIGDLSLSAVFEEARRKDHLSGKLLKEGAFALGAKTSFLVNLLNPEIVIIGGGFEEAPSSFFDECISVIKGFSFSEMRRNLKVVPSQLGRRAIAQGVAAIIFKEKSLQR